VKANEKGKSETQKDPGNSYQRDSRILKWHGWHAARRGLGINLYRLDVSDI
jgi:hypothetical protein